MVIDFEELDRLEAEAGAQLPAAEPPSLRWAVCIPDWHPGAAEWQFLLQLLPAEEQTPVLRFKFEEDRRRAALSRLLQRAAVARCLGLPWGAIDIRRTKGQKPFLASPHPHPRAPNFNFNVSHEGDFVILATETLCIVGVDVAAPQQVRRRGQQPESAAAFFRSFEGVCSPREWAAIRSHPTDDGQLAAFRRHWSLKEAFVKARGDGLGFEPLRRAEFDFGPDPWGPTATLTMDGVPRPDWHFTLEERDGHWLSVARGPPGDVVDANGEFRRTLTDPAPHPVAYAEALRAPAPPFVLVPVRSLAHGPS